MSEVGCGVALVDAGRYRRDMKLSEKGKFALPPKLEPKHAQALSETLASWSGVHARTHWQLGDESVVDGADFYVGDEELGHLHLDGDAHVAMGVALRNALVERGLAHPFRWSREFVTWRVTSSASRGHAEWLFSLRLAALGGASLASLLLQLPQRLTEASESDGARGRSEASRLVVVQE